MESERTYYSIQCEGKRTDDFNSSVRATRVRKNIRTSRGEKRNRGQEFHENEMTECVQQREAVAKSGKRLAHVQQPFAIGKLPGITLKFISRKKNRRALKASDDY